MKEMYMFYILRLATDTKLMNWKENTLSTTFLLILKVMFLSLGTITNYNAVSLVVLERFKNTKFHKNDRIESSVIN